MIKEQKTRLTLHEHDDDDDDDDDDDKVQSTCWRGVMENMYLSWRQLDARNMQVST